MRARSSFRLCMILVAALSGSTALAQTTADPPPSPDEIEVRGKREIDRDIVKRNVRELTAKVPVFEVVPRYFEPLCLHVRGPDGNVNGAIARRILAVASEAGLGQPRPKCRANALVLLSHEPERLFDKLLQRRRDVIGLADRDVRLPRIRGELTARKPGIAWNRTQAMAIGSSEYYDNGIQVLQIPLASRITGTGFRAKVLSVVVLDTTQFVTATPTQLADYAAMHLLGTPRRSIDFEAVTANSILSLFADGPDLAPQELTAFDRAYLKGIYAAGNKPTQPKMIKALLEAYAAQCVDEDADCQFIVPEEAGTP